MKYTGGGTGFDKAEKIQTGKLQAQRKKSVLRCVFSRGEKNRMKKKAGCLKVLLITVGCVVLGMAVLFGLFVLLLYIDDCIVHSEKSARERITDTTGIEIPIDAEMVFLDYNSPFQDPFSQYAVFSFENEPADWLAENDFSRERNTEFEEEFKEAEPSWLKEKVDAVSSEYYPDFENPYYWLNTEKITSGYLRVYFIYEPQEQFLMIYIPSI